MGLTQGRPAKNPEDRVRRNATPGNIPLPLEGYKGDIPNWPLMDPDDREIELWEFHWRLPMAVVWIAQGSMYVLARYIRTLCIVEDDKGFSVATAHMHGELRQLEDRFGLNPLALKRLGWEITAEQAAELKAIQTPKASVTRLRAVDHSLKS